MKRKKIKKPKFMRLMFRKNDPGHNVLAAVSRWVKASGGETVVIGPIGIMEAELPLNFYVTVKCVGRRPQKKKEE